MTEGLENSSEIIVKDLQGHLIENIPIKYPAFSQQPDLTRYDLFVTDLASGPMQYKDPEITRVNNGANFIQHFTQIINKRDQGMLEKAYDLMVEGEKNGKRPLLVLADGDSYGWYIDRSNVTPVDLLRDMQDRSQKAGKNLGDIYSLVVVYVCNRLELKFQQDFINEINVPVLYSLSAVGGGRDNPSVPFLAVPSETISS